MKERWPYIVAHAPRVFMQSKVVFVYRVNRRATLTNALKVARHIQHAGYLVWIEQTGRMATR